MKKSEAYKLAQIAVVSTPTIAPESKLEILKHLFEATDLALFCEGQNTIWRSINTAENSGEV